MKLTQTQLIIGILLIFIIILVIWNPFNKKTDTSSETSSSTDSQRMGGDIKSRLLQSLINQFPDSSSNDISYVRGEINALSNEQASNLYNQTTSATERKMCGGHTGIVGIWHCIKKAGQAIWGH